MAILSDLTCVPSFLGVRSRGRSDYGRPFANIALRQGEVKKIVYPTDPASISKKFTEYVVEVNQSDGTDIGNLMVYTGVTVANLFGGGGDRIEYTLRADDGTQTTEAGTGNGSKVLLLCLNGQTSNAVIIGGIRNYKYDNKDQKEDGHYLNFIFNGLGVNIDQNGAFTLTFQGKTDNLGNLLGDDDTQPTTVSIDEKGTFRASTKDENQSLTIDNDDKKIQIQADEKLEVQVNKDLLMDAGGKASFTVTETADVEVGEALTVTCLEAINVAASGLVSISSPGVVLGSGSEAMPKFSTYRAAESQNNAKIIAALNQMTAALAGVANSLTAAAAALSTGIPGINAAGGALGAAAIGVAQIAGAVGQINGAVTSFESAGVSYLSTKNKSD
jgi:hypothetical protein